MNARMLSVAGLILLSKSASASMEPPLPPPIQTKAPVNIVTPSARMSLTTDCPVYLRYRTRNEPDGNAVQVYLDDHRPFLLHNLAGWYPLGTLSPGRHTLKVQLVDEVLQPVGERSAVTFVVSKGEN